MYQSIITKYCGPTNTRGSRIKVTTSAGKSAYFEWDDAENSEDNHTGAALRMAYRMGWKGRFHGGAMPETRGGYVFVMESRGGSFEVQA